MINRRERETVWLVNLFFGVGAAPTGVLLESVALGLEARGYHVEVIAGRVGYNRAAAQSGQRFRGRVHRLFAGPTAAEGKLGRLLSWLCFWLTTAWFAFTRPLPDKVVVMTTPPFLHVLFALRNRLSRRKAELILWNQDTYPEVLAAVGIAPQASLRFKVLAWLQRRTLVQVRTVIVLDHAMAEILRRQGARHLEVIPNWEADLDRVDPMAAGTLIEAMRRARARFRWVLLYTGNYGWGHDLTILFDYLRRHPGQRDFFFAFVGGGEKWPSLRQLPQEIPDGSVLVADYVPRPNVAALITEADIGLVCLQRDCVGLMSPSKIHGYLMQGKPLLYLGSAGSNVDDAIVQFGCGWRVGEDDLTGLEDCLASWLRPEFDYASWSQRAAIAAARRYNEAVGVADMVRVIHGS